MYVLPLPKEVLKKQSSTFISHFCYAQNNPRKTFEKRIVYSLVVVLYSLVRKFISNCIMKLFRHSIKIGQHIKKKTLKLKTS